MNSIPEKTKYFFLILGLLFVTDLNPVTTDAFLVVVFLILILYFHFKSLKYNPGIFIIIIFFLIINYSNALFYEMFQITTLIGMILRLLIPYYIIKILKQDFIIYYEKIIYFFALLSIPFYILQFIKPDIYLQLIPFFRPMMMDARYDSKIYSFVLHTVHYDLLYRNCGFVWEPGGFGYILGLAIMFNVMRNNFNLNKKLLILLLVGLTTLSTTFYIFVLVLLAIYLYEKKRNIIILFFALPMIILISIYITQLPFLSEKIEKEIKSPPKMKSTEIEAGRFGGLNYDFDRFIEYPFGYGINTNFEGKNISGGHFFGPSGVGNFLRMWGIIGLLFLIYSLYNFSKRLSIIYRNQNKIFIMITIFLFLFSNPIERDPIFLIIVYFPLFILTKESVNANIYNFMIAYQK